MADEALPSDHGIALTPSVPASRSPSEITAGSTAALTQGTLVRLGVLVAPGIPPRDYSPRQVRSKTADAGPSEVGSWHEGESERGAKPVRLCPCSSDVNLFGYGQSIIDFNTEIPDGAFDLRMSQ